MANIDELENRQKAMREMAAKMKDEKDGAKIAELGAQLAEHAKALQESAARLEADFKVVRPGGETKVMLTPEQRKRLADKTGHAIEVVTIEGDGETWRGKMPKTEPRLIEQLAMKEISKRALEQEKRDALEKVVKQIEEAVPDPIPEVKEAIEELKRQAKPKKN